MADGESAEVEIAVFNVTYIDESGIERVVEYPSIRVRGRIIAYGRDGVYDQPEGNVPQPARTIPFGRTLLKLARIMVKVGVLVTESTNDAVDLDAKSFILKVGDLILSETGNAREVVQELKDYEWSAVPVNFASLSLESSAKSFQLLDYIGFNRFVDFFYQFWIYVYNYYNRGEPEVHV